MADFANFKIQNGILKKYTGNGSEVTIPNGVRKIDEKAFWGRKSLTAVTIPDGVTEIGARAFWGCKSLTTITVPDSVTKIGARAFWGCKTQHVCIN